MKITFLLARYDRKPVGGFKVVYEYANQLATRGHEVTIVHPRSLPNDYTPPLINRLRKWPIERIWWRRRSIIISGVPWFSVNNRVKLLSVPELIASYIPDGDAVIGTYWATAEYVINYPPQKGKGFYLLQAYEIWTGPEERVHATWRAPLAKIVIAQWLYEQGLKLGVPADHMMYVPLGLDHSKYRIIHPIDKRPPRIAMLYHYLAVKGAEDGIKALELARGRLPAMQAVLFGVVRRPRSLPSWIDYCPLPSQEELVNDIYNGSSVYLCPSWSEGWHLPPAEAMACGCAVVSTDIGGVRDYAEHGVTALLSPPKDPDKLADNICRLLEDSELRIKLANAGNKLIQTFTWDRSTNLFEQAILSASGGRFSNRA